VSDIRMGQNWYKFNRKEKTLIEKGTAFIARSNGLKNQIRRLDA
jgi:hypothetical protein